MSATYLQDAHAVKTEYKTYTSAYPYVSISFDKYVYTYFSVGFFPPVSHLSLSTIDFLGFKVSYTLLE